MDNAFLRLQIESLQNALYIIQMTSKKMSLNCDDKITPTKTMTKLWELINNKSLVNNNDINYSELTCDLLDELLTMKIRNIKQWNDVIEIYCLLGKVVENKVHSKVIHKFTNILYDINFNTKLIQISGNNGWDNFSPSINYGLMTIILSTGIGIGLLSLTSWLGFSYLRNGMYFVKPSFQITKSLTFAK